MSKGGGEFSVRLSVAVDVPRAIIPVKVMST